MPSPIIPTAKSVNAGCCFWIICISNVAIELIWRSSLPPGRRIRSPKNCISAQTKEERTGHPKHFVTLTGVLLMSTSQLRRIPISYLPALRVPEPALPQEELDASRSLEMVVPEEQIVAGNTPHTRPENRAFYPS